MIIVGITLWSTGKFSCPPLMDDVHIASMVPKALGKFTSVCITCVFWVSLVIIMSFHQKEHNRGLADADLYVSDAWKD